MADTGGGEKSLENVTRLFLGRPWNSLSSSSGESSFSIKGRQLNKQACSVLPVCLLCRQNLPSLPMVRPMMFAYTRNRPKASIVFSAPGRATANVQTWSLAASTRPPPKKLVPSSRLSSDRGWNVAGGASLTQHSSCQGSVARVPGPHYLAVQIAKRS